MELLQDDGFFLFVLVSCVTDLRVYFLELVSCFID